MHPTRADLEVFFSQARPRRLRSLKAFAEAEIVIPDGPFEGQRFKCSRQPYTRLWFDEVDSGRWSRCVATGPTQSGKTLACFVMPTLYHLFELQETVICGLPDMDMASDKWREDLLPVIERSRYRDLLPLRGGGSRGGRVESLQFRNGATLKFMTGGGGDKSRAGFTARVVVVTETDGMDQPGGTSRESDKITQLEARHLVSRCSRDSSEVGWVTDHRDPRTSELVDSCRIVGGKWGGNDVFRKVPFVGVLLIGSLYCRSVVVAQCEFDWRSGDGIKGLYGGVASLLRWDPDGEGSEREVLVAGGAFGLAWNAPPANVAIWNGKRWRALGNGWDGYVTALILYEGSLIAAGQFSRAGGTAVENIARWNGATWEPLGSGVSGPVQALATDGVDLFVALNDPKPNVFCTVMRWDGARWHPLGSGFNSRVHRIVLFDGELIAGGEFTSYDGKAMRHIARWDGGIWQELGGGTDEQVSALAVADGRLLVGGGFQMVGEVPAERIASWDGSNWTPFAEGFHAGTVSDIYAREGKLLAVGNLQASDWLWPSNIGRWTGNSWERYAGCLTASTVAEFDGDLIGNGGNTALDYDLPIARWDGTECLPMIQGVDGAVGAMTYFNGEVIVGGNFVVAGGERANGVARWDGTDWRAMGKGLTWPEAPVPGFVYAFAVFDGDLIAGGDFTHTEDTVVNRIARWDGMTWQALGSGLEGPYPHVAALVVHDQKLVVAGSFTSAGGVAVQNIARWDGVDWEPMGDDWSQLYAIAVYQGQLVAAGHSTALGGVAYWNGAGWMPVGNLVDSAASALAVHEGELVAAGWFREDLPSGGFRLHGMARWNGVQSRFGPRTGYLGSVHAMASYQGNLVIAGGFTSVDETPARHVARWDGSEWFPLGSGVEDWRDLWTRGSALSLMPLGQDLYVGGQFLTAGEDNVSAYFARWGPNRAFGDTNHDERISWLDVEGLVGCLGGPFSPQRGTGVSEECQCSFNSDGDADVDLQDVGRFQESFGR